MSDPIIIDVGKIKSQLGLLLSGIAGAINRLAENVAPVDTSLAKVLEDGFADLGKWQSIQDESLRAGFASVVEAIANIQPLPPPQPNRVEVIMDFVVKDDHADVPFSLKLGAVTDAEGNEIPDAQVETTVESDNPAAVSVTYDPATKGGVASFGSPGSATIRANVNSGGVLLGTGTAGFTVTTGDPAAIAGVDLAFEGLEEAPPA